MSLKTKLLELFKYEPDKDGASTFNIKAALNDNWDKIEAWAQSVKTALAGLVPTSRKINGKDLTADRTLTGKDIPMSADDAESLWAAMAKREELKADLDALETQQAEWQEKINTLSTIDQTIEESKQTRKTASEPYYKGQLETREMDDIITALLLKHNLFPQSLSLQPGDAEAVSSYLAPDVQPDSSSSDESSSSEASDSTDETAAPAESTEPRYIHIGKASLEAAGDTADWLAFLDEVENTFGGLRVTDFTVTESRVIEDNVRAVTTNTIDAEIDLYMCIPEEADA